MSRKARNTPSHGRNTRRRTRERKPRYLIVCGGTVTEPEYFRWLTKDRDMAVEIAPKEVSPSQLARIAVKRQQDDKRDSSVDSYKKIFVVVDVDDFHDHAAAQRLCKEHGIHLIISNPCFEVWLLDHLGTCPDACSLTPDVERRAADAQVTEGARNKYINFSVIEGHLDDALRNAARHNTMERLTRRDMLTPNQEHAYAPWTDMPKPVQEMGLDQPIDGSKASERN